MLYSMEEDDQVTERREGGMQVLRFRRRRTD